MALNNENQVRERVKALKEFYTSLVIYALISLACILIWLSTGGGFWPIWVMLGLSASAGMQGVRLGIFPMISELLPFLKPEWEDEQVKTILNEVEPPKKPTTRRKDEM